MKTLFIDSSRKDLAIAIASSDEIIFISKVNGYYRHSNFLMKEIVNSLTKTNLTIKDIDNIVVLNGPGSFTGVRVGVTIAKTLAWILKKNIYSLTTLEALSLQVSDSNVISAIADKSFSGYVGIYIDNLKKESYYNVQNVEDLVNDKKITLVCLNKDEFINNLYDVLNKNNEVIVKVIDNYDYLKVIRNALSNASLNPHLVEPVYLKKIDAEKNCD